MENRWKTVQFRLGTHVRDDDDDRSIRTHTYIQVYIIILGYCSMRVLAVEGSKRTRNTPIRQTGPPMFNRFLPSTLLFRSY